MPKHIRIRGKLAENKATVVVTLISQTHTGPLFGDTNPEGSTLKTDLCTFVHGRVRLYSYPSIRMYKYYPFEAGSPNDMWILLEASGEVTGIRYNEIRVTLQEWKDIKDAVEAYNTWGSSQP